MITTEAELDDRLSEPYPETVELFHRLEGGVVLLGAGGKMGPTLARMCRRAAKAAGRALDVIAVSRFSDADLRRQLESSGVRTVAGDLADPAFVETIPALPNVIYMAGRKFGDRGSEPATWMMNAGVPALVGRRFRESRIVVFSTGCVYPLVTAHEGESRETDDPAPVGEYANSCLGRERLFEYYSRENGTAVLQFRLNYAVELRYGVLVDLAQQIQAVGGRVRPGVSHVNVIWQGDANNRALLCLEHAASPPAVLNITGSETFEVAALAARMADLMGKHVEILQPASAKCYLADASRSIELFGQPRVGVDQVLEWTADWIRRNRRTLGKPTHYEVTDGQFLD